MPSGGLRVRVNVVGTGDVGSSVAPGLLGSGATVVAVVDPERVEAMTKHRSWLDNRLRTASDVIAGDLDGATFGTLVRVTSERRATVPAFVQGVTVCTRCRTQAFE